MELQRPGSRIQLRKGRAKLPSDELTRVTLSKFDPYVSSLISISFNDNTFFVQVEVGPSSFLKIKMLGKGDVGRVYLVKEKKTDKLFAMKGRSGPTLLLPVFHLRFQCSQRRR
jgi:serine/threonine protein kinase